jgi:acyl-CoA thioesterase-1
MVSFGKHRHRFAAAVLAATLAPLCSQALAAAPTAPSCRVPDTFLDVSGELDRTEALVLRKRPVRVMMLGASGIPQEVLEQALEKRMPGSSFDVDITQSPGLIAEDFDRLRTVVVQTAPDLVIWQVGVRDAMAASDVDDFEAMLDRASDWVGQNGPDLLLVDPPFVAQVPHERIYIPYVGEIAKVSRAELIPMLRRYASMQYLSEKADRLSTDQRPCVPELMAEAISRAVRP